MALYIEKSYYSNKNANIIKRFLCNCTFQNYLIKLNPSKADLSSGL